MSDVTQAVEEAPGRTAAERRALAQEYMPFVRSIAAKVKKSMAREIDYDDLVEYGVIGLLEAADRYDASQGASFMTFAYYRIRGAIYDGLRGMGWMSRSEYARARLEERANEYLAGLAASPPAGPAPAGSAVDRSVERLAQVVGGIAAVYVTTLDGVEASRLQDESATADQALGLDEARALVRATVDKLPLEERQLLEMYYYQDLSLERVGQILGLSKSWTSRLHARVISKLHRMLDQALGPG